MLQCTYENKVVLTVQQCPSLPSGKHQWQHRLQKWGSPPSKDKGLLQQVDVRLHQQQPWVEEMLSAIFWEAINQGTSDLVVRGVKKYSVSWVI